MLNYFNTKEITPEENNTPALNSDLRSFIENRQNKEHPLYRTQKKKSLLYKFVFLVISLFFIGMTYYTYSLSTSWICTVYLENCALIKGFVCTLCLLMALAAFKLCYIICPKKETAYKILKRYEEKFIKFNRTFELHENVEQLYPELRKIPVTPLQEEMIIDKMYELYEEAIHLLEEITSHKTSDKNLKQSWINQTFVEFQEKLNWMTGIADAEEIKVCHIQTSIT